MNSIVLPNPFALVYVSNATTPSLEYILNQCNWSTPQLRMLICSSSRDCIKDAPWLKLENALPSSYKTFPWVKLTVEERKIMKKNKQLLLGIRKFFVLFKKKKVLNQSAALA